ncbi:DUF642 domain-containing protein [Streptomyces sp. HNM0574]|uniref:DUF642 domain-containing protein n=1 Tax=Streptomyces sp. HNM0574 TaxID=2714954 RepID=UPI00146B19E1|nr:DUF642 domain-containing protein [Streptomyces sp. HNM0574]NLU70498.1 DUF642 domain-containing protein [Streptomyces sp. HNM0574]
MKHRSAPLAAVAAGAALLAAATAAHADPVPVSNGSFDSPHLASSYRNVYGNSTEITGWTTTGSGVDLYSASLCEHPAGTQCIDLNREYSPGGIERTLTVTPGSTVTITFDSTRSPYGSCNTWYGGNVPFTVGVDGEEPKTIDPPRRTSNRPPDWTPQTYTFVATKDTYTLSFTSLPETSSRCGAALTNVRATEEPNDTDPINMVAPDVAAAATAVTGAVWLLIRRARRRRAS